MKRLLFPRLFDPDSPLASRSVLFYPERARMAKMSIVLGSSFAAAFAVLIAILVLSPGKQWLYLTGDIVIAFLFVASCASAWSGIRYLNGKPPQYCVNLLPKGLEVAEPKRTRVYLWADFAFFTETDAAFTLTLKGTLARLDVPKPGMATGQVAKTRAALAEHLPSRSPDAA